MQPESLIFEKINGFAKMGPCNIYCSHSDQLMCAILAYGYYAITYGTEASILTAMFAIGVQATITWLVFRGMTAARKLHKVNLMSPIA